MPELRPPAPRPPPASMLRSDMPDMPGPAAVPAVGLKPRAMANWLRRSCELGRQSRPVDCAGARVGMHVRKALSQLCTAQRAVWAAKMGCVPVTCLH